MLCSSRSARSSKCIIKRHSSHEYHIDCFCNNTNARNYFLLPGSAVLIEKFQFCFQPQIHSFKKKLIRCRLAEAGNKPPSHTRCIQISNRIYFFRQNSCCMGKIFWVEDDATFTVYISKFSRWKAVSVSGCYAFSTDMYCTLVGYSFSRKITNSVCL